MQVKTPLPSVCFGPLPIPEGRQVIGALHCAGSSSPLRTLQPIFAQHSSSRCLVGLQGPAGLLGPGGMGWDPSPPLMHAVNSVQFFFASVVLCPALSGIRSDPSKSFVPRTIMIGGKVTCVQDSVHAWLSGDVGKVLSPFCGFARPAVG